MSYSLGYTYSLNSNAGANSASGAIGRIIYEKDQIFALNINIPLSKFLPSTWAGYSLNTSKNGNTTNSISMSGTALQNDALSWGI